MRKRVFILLLLFSLLSPVFIVAQSSLLDDGVSGSFFNLEGAIIDSELNKIGFSAGYSIGGVMDFGVSLNTESGTIDDNESTDINFSMLYNILIIKQNETTPINLQIEGSYGFINTNSDYLDYYNRRKTGQGFNFGSYLFYNFFSKTVLNLQVGARVIYTNYLFQTLDFEDPNLPKLVLEDRSEDIRYGGSIGLSFKPKFWPILSVKVSAVYSQTDEKLYFSPVLSIVNSDY